MRSCTPRSSTKAGGLRIRGFEVTAPAALDGIKVENGRNVEIVDSEIHHTGRQGILVAGTGRARRPSTSNVQIWNNRFHDNGGYSGDRLDHSIYWGGVGSNTDGIDHTTYGGVIANNLFYNQPYGFQLQIGSQADGLIVTNNTFYRATGAYPAGGTIALYTESPDPRVRHPQRAHRQQPDHHAANYGVYGSGGGGLMSTNLVRNNLAYSNATGRLPQLLRLDRPTSSSSSGRTSRGRIRSSSNPGGLDFRLQAGSPGDRQGGPGLYAADRRLGQGPIGRARARRVRVLGRAGSMARPRAASPTTPPASVRAMSLPGGRAGRRC